MRRYLVEVTAQVEVLAENAAEADRLARKMRIVRAAASGARRPGPHDREWVHYDCRLLGYRRSLRPA